jgi:predicted enzyme related to lactoylglutathione lyase
MIPGLSFLELTVADWPAALAWYTTQFGLEVVLRVDADQFALLQAGQGRIALRAGRPQPGTVLLAFEVDDLPRELDRLAAAGIRPAAPLKGSAEGYRRAIVQDPDGYRLCLFDWRGRP